MKKIKLISLLFCAVTSWGHAIEKDIEKFLESRPCYKKTASDIHPSLKKHLKYTKYLDYFLDSAYFCERADVTLIALVRKKKIVGFQIILTDLHYFSKSDAEHAVRQVYESKGFELVDDGGSIGINDKDYQVYLFLEKEAYDLAKEEAAEELLKTLNP
jgi:hypothetical protein